MSFDEILYQLEMRETLQYSEDQGIELGPQP